MTLIQVVPSGDGWKVTEDGEEIDTVAEVAGRAHSRALSAEFSFTVETARSRRRTHTVETLETSRDRPLGRAQRALLNA